jgi:hypothetical protein
LSGRPSSPRPIGVFDSGVGGLTVVAALRGGLARRILGDPEVSLELVEMV